MREPGARRGRAERGRRERRQQQPERDARRRRHARAAERAHEPRHGHGARRAEADGQQPRRGQVAGHRYLTAGIATSSAVVKRTSCAPSTGPMTASTSSDDDELGHEGERLVLDLRGRLHDAHDEPHGHAREQRRRREQQHEQQALARGAQHELEAAAAAHR